jgi:hypothetical protein
MGGGDTSMTRFGVAQKPARDVDRRNATVSNDRKQAGQPATSLEGAMADKSNDPVALWHTMLGEMEKGFNAFANQAMASPEFSRVVNQVGGASAGAQKQLGELMEKYLSSMNLPSRAQLANFGERLQAIEGQLNEITALLRQVHSNSGADGSPATPKPPRTKRPPPASGAPR